MTTSSVRALERLATWPRTPLVHAPTPLRRLTRLSAELGGPPIYAKMDAETGFALGGNKVRKLEFQLSPDRIDGVTDLITAGGPQSNHCRVTAAFAAHAGLRCVLVVNAPAPDTPTGNALLHRLFGAEIVVVPERDDRVPSMDLVARRIEAEGGHPMVVPIGASTGIGSLGYVAAAVELAEQIDSIDDGFDRSVVLVSASSCGTIAGLQAGFSLLQRDDVRLLGVSADAPTSELADTTRRLAAEAATLLGGSEPHRCRVDFDDRQVGAGYGLTTTASLAATDLFGRLEGIVLDPTYTSKAAAGLIEQIRQGVPAGERVVFVHTGGAPGLLA
ncbi:MAG: D-cysteine desulfhydrase family protein [Gemmatimonadota bacterium]